MSYKVRVTDPDLCKILQMVSHRRGAKIPNKRIAVKLGIKLKPVRNCIYLGPDHKFNHSYIGLIPEFDLDFKKINDKIFYFEFKRIF